MFDTVRIGLSIVAMAAFASPAAALITVGASNGSGVVQTDENVQFNDDPPFDYTNINPLLTLTNGGVGVTLTGLENLTAPSGGQARITGSDDNLTYLEYKLTNPLLGFQTTEFNINVPNKASGTANIYMYDQFNNKYSLLNSVIENGSNWFYGFASDNQSIVRVVIQTSIDAEDIRQIRLGEIEAIPTDVVPEPATWAMLIAGFGLVGGAMRRRRGVAHASA